MLISLCLLFSGVSVAVLCRNAGQCVDVGNTHLCRCQAGYKGSYCQEQVDECMPNPCQNGATCTDYLGGYSCEVETHTHTHTCATSSVLESITESMTQITCFRECNGIIFRFLELWKLITWNQLL